MASLYKRNGNWWVRYKVGGVWKGKATCYRIDRKNETRLAKLVAARLTDRELAETPQSATSERLLEWVPGWLKLVWGTGPVRTLKRYQRIWRVLADYLQTHSIEVAGQVTRELCLAYPEWRLQHHVGRNTSLAELNLLVQILDESIKGGELNRNHFGDWLHVTFLLGLFQAARLRQGMVPLECIDFSRQVITYPANIVKGGRPHSQPIDPRVLETLRAIVVMRQSQGAATLCDVPVVGSVEWRRFLDSLGLPELSQHGLRATYITRAALAGVPMSLTMKFVNHASAEVHRIYQVIGVDDLGSIHELIKLPLTDGLTAATCPQLVSP